MEQVASTPFLVTAKRSWFLSYIRLSLEGVKLLISASELVLQDVPLIEQLVKVLRCNRDVGLCPACWDLGIRLLTTLFLAYLLASHFQALKNP